MLRILRLVARSFSLLAAVAFTALGGSREFHRQFRVGGEAALSIRTQSGSVRIEGTGGETVTISAEITGREKDVNAFDLVADQAGSRVDLRGDIRSADAWPWYTPDLTVTVTITVPRACSLQVHTREGFIAVRNVKGPVSGETSMGDISFAHIDGSADFETAGGSVRADTCAGTLALRTSAGSVWLRDLRGDVDVSSSAGDISVLGAEGMVRAQTGGGNVTIGLRAPFKGVHAESSGGDVSILLPPGAPATIDAEAGGGLVRYLLPTRVIGEEHLRALTGKINGGGQEVFAHTIGGDVEISAAASQATTEERP